MTEDEIRAIVLQVIAERTMPREFSMPDDDWLIPFNRWIQSSTEIGQWFDRIRTIEKEIRRLKAKVEEHLP